MKAEGVFEPSNIEADTRLGLPKKFLSALYQEGYEVVELPTNTMSFIYNETYDTCISDINIFFCAVSHQMARHGIYFTGESLREEVINYEKKNADVFRHSALLRAPLSCSYGEKSVEKHISEFERDVQMANAFDIDCTAKMLGAEVIVFFVNDKFELSSNRFNEKGGDGKSVIAIVIDPSQFPVRVFSTKVVHKRNAYDNPFYEKKN